MNHDPLQHVDRLLARPPLAPTPQGLHGRVLVRIAATPPVRARRAPFVRIVGPLAAAAAVAVAALLALRAPPAPPARSAVSRSDPLSFSIDPTPALVPVSRFVAGSLDAPVRDQIDSLLDDTRRARDLVVSCLPFSAQGG